MIYQITNLKFLEDQLKLWIEITAAAEVELAQPQPRPSLARHGWDKDTVRQMSELLHKAAAELEKAKLVAAEEYKMADELFIAGDQNLCLAQAMMHGGYLSAGLIDESAAKGATGGELAGAEMSLAQDALPPQGQKLFGSIFDEPGPGYVVGWLRGIGYGLLRKRQPFTKPGSAVRLGKKARIVLAGDWGTGHKRALKISEMMRRCLDVAPPDADLHAVHLGDIYFAGLPDECANRFLQYWPSQPASEVKHWCINGNHDMYCGGDGYYKVVLGNPRFAAQRRSSNFVFGNEHWQLIGLDTAYEEWRLADDKTGDQAAWAAGIHAQAPNSKRILLSHHQPHSDFEGSKQAAQVAADAAPLLQDGHTAAWLWGHEHRCAIYSPLTFSTGGSLPFGACLGHGGVPCAPTKEKGENTRHVLTGKEGTIPGNLGETYGLMGFAVIDIEGGKAELRCYHENDPQMTAPHFTAQL